jgi:hypothetical protein
MKVHYNIIPLPFWIPSMEHRRRNLTNKRLHESKKKMSLELEHVMVVTTLRISMSIDVEVDAPWFIREILLRIS